MTPSDISRNNTQADASGPDLDIVVDDPQVVRDAQPCSCHLGHERLQTVGHLHDTMSSVSSQSSLAV